MRLDTASDQHRNQDTAFPVTRLIPDTTMSDLSRLKSRQQSTIYATELLLAAMTTPVQDLAQELEYTVHINRINDLTLETNADFLDIAIEHKDDIDITELDDFRTSMTNMKHRTSTIFMDLCTWKTSNTDALLNIHTTRTGTHRLQ